MASPEHTRDLMARSSATFEARASMMTLFQELAEQCYPERADFTMSRSEGEDFAAHLFSAEPVMMRRDLANAYAYLRARDRDWFRAHEPDDKVRKQAGVEAWLQDKSKVMRRVLYDKRAGFNRAMRGGENSFAAFGDACLSCEVNDKQDGLRFCEWHIKDVAWGCDAYNKVNTVYRDMTMTARQMTQYFGARGDNLHESVKRCLEKQGDKNKTFPVRHLMFPSNEYDGKKIKLPWASIYIDMNHAHVVREMGSHELRYIIARWEMMANSVMAVSPPSMTALPESRAHQALARIIQEAGEKSVDPPMTSIEAYIRGDINLEAGGMTAMDTTDYDIKQYGEILKPLYLAKNPGIGFDLLERGRNVLANAWFINKIALPDRGTKTAYEIAELIEEHIRANVPLTEPVQDELHEPALELSAQILLRVGAFGTVQDMPPALRGREMGFAFSNPLTEALARTKTQRFQGLINNIAMVKSVSQETPIDADFDLRIAARDVAIGENTPAEWMVDKDKADEMAEAMQEARQAQQAVQAIGGAGAAAEAAGKGGKAVAEADFAGQQIAA